MFQVEKKKYGKKQKIIKVHKKSRKKDKIKKKEDKKDTPGTLSSQYLVAGVPAWALTPDEPKCDWWVHIWLVC